jgi:6-phosphogluconate dehydrogenase
LEKALLAAKIVSYAQGFSLMAAASREHGWSLDLGAVALLWRGGCIIRSVFLGRIKEAFDAGPDLGNLMLAPWFREKLSEGQSAWRRVVSTAVLHGIPVPSLSAGLNYYDGYRCAALPANLLQAQRDYFGAHTYERTDRPRGEFFHTRWLE